MLCEEWCNLGCISTPARLRQRKRQCEAEGLATELTLDGGVEASRRDLHVHPAVAAVGVEHRHEQAAVQELVYEVVGVFGRTSPERGQLVRPAPRLFKISVFSCCSGNPVAERPAFSMSAPTPGWVRRWPAGPPSICAARV